MKTVCPFHTTEVHEWDDTNDFLAEVRRRSRVLDVVGLLLVPAAYLLSLLGNRRRHFWAFFGFVLLVVPFVISLAHLPFRTAGVTLGFSGLAMALYGYASLVFVGYLATRLATAVHLDHAPLVFLSQTAVIAVAVYLVAAVRAVQAPGSPFEAELNRAGYAEVAILAVLVLSFLLVTGFAVTRLDGHTVNLFSHFVGFATGFLAAYVVLRTDCSLSHVAHCASPDADCQVHDSPFTRLLRRVVLAVGS